MDWGARMGWRGAISVTQPLSLMSSNAIVHTPKNNNFRLYKKRDRINFRSFSPEKLYYFYFTN